MHLEDRKFGTFGLAMIWHSTYIAASWSRRESKEFRDGDGSAHRPQFAQTLYSSLAREGSRRAAQPSATRKAVLMSIL
jgi:hypothetical protein